MRIAIISLPDKPTLTTSKGGVEVWTAGFTQELSRRGHSIDLYAATGSLEAPGVTLHKIVEHPLNYYYDDPFFTDDPELFRQRKEQLVATIFTRVLLSIREHQDDYDIIIDSCSYPTFTFSTGYLDKPVVSIGHFPIEFALSFYPKLFSFPENNVFVYPSKYQLIKAERILKDKVTYIPHGIDPHQFIFDQVGGQEMSWMARVHQRMDKGVREALQVAKIVQKPLLVTAFVEPSTEDLYQHEVLPLVSKYSTIRRVTNDDTVDKQATLGSKKLFLYPIQWEEPFGLVVTEAMACGTPVVAFARGAMPEIIEDGKTGFLVNASEDDKRGDYIIKKTGIEGLVEAVGRIYGLSEADYRQMRQYTRERLLAFFSLEVMVDQYERLFNQLTALGNRA